MAVEKLIALRKDYAKCNLDLIAAQGRTDDGQVATLVEKFQKLEAELLQAHINVGRPVREWTMLLEYEKAKGSYYNNVFTLFTGDWESWEKVEKVALAVRPQLIEFCVASGIDSVDVDNYLLEIETQCMEYLPK